MIPCILLALGGNLIDGKFMSSVLIIFNQCHLSSLYELNDLLTEAFKLIMAGILSWLQDLEVQNLVFRQLLLLFLQGYL